MATGVSGWSLLLCLSSSEQSCLRRVSFPHLRQHQMVRLTCSPVFSQSQQSPACVSSPVFLTPPPRHQVNLIPGLMEAFSDSGGGVCHLFTLTGGCGSDSVHTSGEFIFTCPPVFCSQIYPEDLSPVVWPIRSCRFQGTGKYELTCLNHEPETVYLYPPSL